jgi:hypothetical protein
MVLTITTIDVSSLDLDRVPRYITAQNRAGHRNALRALLMISLLTVFVGVPVFFYISIPFVQITQPLVTSVGINTMASLHCGQFLWYVITHWGAFPGFWDWVNWLVEMGLSYALACAIAYALVKAGWISAATFAAVVGGMTGGVGLIVLAGAAAAF